MIFISNITDINVIREQFDVRAIEPRATCLAY